MDKKISEFVWYDHLNLVYFVSLQEAARLEVSNHIIQGNFIKSRKIGHHVQGILCKGLASML